MFCNHLVPFFFASLFATLAASGCDGLEVDDQHAVAIDKMSSDLQLADKLEALNDALADGQPEAIAKNLEAFIVDAKPPKSFGSSSCRWPTKEVKELDVNTDGYYSCCRVLVEDTFEKQCTVVGVCNYSGAFGKVCAGETW